MNENSQLPTQVSNDWLDHATSALQAAEIPSARLDAELILSHTLRKTRTYLHAHPDHVIDDREREIADARLALRLDRVPVAYIIGHKEFYGHRFHVTSATLIPRPESEDLIDLLKHTMTSPPDGYRLVDVGTGSGILGITAKLLYPELDVTLADKSRHALAIAEKNAKSHDVDVTLLHSDLLAVYAFTADIILANLPYVDKKWERSPETEHEPAEALFAAKNGLSLIEELLIQTQSHLSSNGRIILEADPQQHPAITTTAASYGLLLEKKEGYGLLFRKVTGDR